MISFRVLPALLLAPALLVGCGVGSTATTVPPGERSFATLIEATPAPEYGETACADDTYYDCFDGTTTVVPMMSSEVRLGLDARSDWGVRTIGYSGLVATYKRSFAADTSGLQGAVIGGIGMLNGFNTLAGEVTVVVSPPERSAVTPYGGLRLQQTLPLNNSPQDSPTAGLFAGVRFGSRDFGISPEVGVHYDRSALRLRERAVVVVPVITLHGRGFLDGLFPGF